MTPSNVLRSARLAPLGLATLLLAGCASAQFGSELSARPKARAIDKIEGAALHLPQDQPYNITLPKVTKEPRLEGTADADALAKPTGDGSASATVTNGGKAEGIFQIGHALTNATDRQADFEFRVRYNYEFEARATTELALPDASVGLRLYARSERGRLLRDLVLVQHTTENGAAQRSAGDSLTFTLTLAPGETVDVFVAGQAKIEVPDGRSASCALKITGLQMDVTTRPAPAVPASAPSKP
jgi:hypothetical protein